MKYVGSAHHGMKARMTVSADAGSAVRHAVADGIRPEPEFLRMEQRHSVELVDWSKLGVGSGGRSVMRSVIHAQATLTRLPRADVLLSDGEHVGFPLALGLRFRRRRPVHVMLGHHLLSTTKERVFRAARLDRGMDRILVHSANQVPRIASRYHLAEDRIHVLPYGVDEAFWSERPGQPGPDEGLVVSAGREHRDYRTLVAARPEGCRLAIADHSRFSPDAIRSIPAEWPPEVTRLALEPAGLRDLYARAAVVVVPVVETDFPAGITTLLEAMAMGKAVVVTATSAMSQLVGSGCASVEPGDVVGMRRAIERLLGDQQARADLGRAARARIESSFTLNRFVDGLHRHLVEAAAAGLSRATSST